MMRGPSPGSMMGGMGSEMYSMGGPGPNMSGGPMATGPGPNPGGPNQMMSASGPMFGPKTSPVNMNMGGGMGGAPDTAQPLPPSMGQSGNFKNNPFMGPTTADPTYAAQFHSFQQQLYATNTRGGPNMGMPGPIGPGGPNTGPPGGPPGMSGPGPMPGQGFPFNPK